MIQCNNELSNSQIMDLEKLISDCKKCDDGTPNMHWHILSQARDFNANVLFYDKKELLGFMAAFFFYDDACEVCVLVHPKARRQGIATKLFETVLPTIFSQQCQRVIFSMPSGLNDSWVPNSGFHYHQSDFQMERTSLSPILSFSRQLNIRKAQSNEWPILLLLDEACFKNRRDDAPAHFSSLLQKSQYTIFIAEYNGQAIGKAHLRFQNQTVFFSDIAIFPAFQKRGFGNELLVHCINYGLLQNISHMRLDVATTNQHALLLYQRNGFKTIYQTDYWQTPLKSLLNLIIPK